MADQFPARRVSHRPQVRRPRLTPRQREVLKLAAAGCANKEIGAAIGLSTQTVKVHLSAAMRELGVSDRTQAVAEALRRGWLVLDEVGHRGKPPR